MFSLYDQVPGSNSGTKQDAEYSTQPKSALEKSGIVETCCFAESTFYQWNGGRMIFCDATLLCGAQCSVALPCLTLCNSMDCSPPGSSVPGILQARILEWVAKPSSRGLNPGLPTLQADSLLAELTGKLNDHIRLSVFSIIIHSSELLGYDDRTLDIFYIPILQVSKTEDGGLFVPGPCLIHQGIELHL